MSSKTDDEAEELPIDELGESLWNEPESYLVEEEEEQEIIYYSEDLISGPYLSDASTIEGNILEFDHSYGYDCKKHFNLAVADEDTLIFLSGNLINFFNVKTKQLWFRRSAYGGGLGTCKKNPNPIYQHIAIAENGKNPPIIIYEWPSLEVVCLLKGGSTKCYTHMDYSPDGELLVTQAGDPDYLITVFNWPRKRIMLRTKSNVNDVYRVKFSPFCEGQLTTCGLAHIKFWKMATTFTGLKLQGELGRFGKTEYSDILGVLPMPDEKVVSGCAWGNILIWDDGLIKVEVMRKLRKTCHDGPIVQLEFKDGELWTTSMDGKVKVWYYDTIDLADPPDDDRVVQMEPIYEFHTPGTSFMSIKKVNSDPNDGFFYAQDGNGGLWKIDLSTENAVQPSVQLYKTHAGPIYDIATCPWGNYIASIGDDGRLHVYNYVKRTFIFNHQFPAKGRTISWLPLSIEQSGNEIIMGFDDGNLRSVFLAIDEDKDKVEMTLIQVIKPHHKPITCMSIRETSYLLITGSEDATIFIFQLERKLGRCTQCYPIGYVPAPAHVTCLTWHLTDDTTILVGCLYGQFMEVKVPRVPQDYTTITYLLKCQPIHQKFITYKAQIRRNIIVAQIEARKEEKLQRKRDEMERILKENPGLEIDEEVFLADSESEEVLEPLFIPDIPNRIIWMQYTNEGTIWLSMGGYDAGYIYEYKMDQTEEIPYRFQMVFDGDDTEISSFVYNYNNKYFICAMQDGSIRVHKVNPDDFRDLTDYWKLSMHDNLNGFVPKMCFSFDERYFFSCGFDGNLFSYKFCPENEDFKSDLTMRIPTSITPAAAHEVTDYETLSLEEAIVKAEIDRKNKVANEHKQLLIDELAVLKDRFADLLQRNNALLPTQIISRKELEIDPRITENLMIKLEADLELVKRKLAYDVEKSEVGMKKLLKHLTDPLDVLPLRVYNVDRTAWIDTLRQRKLGEEFEGMVEIIDQKILEAELKARPPERPAVVATALPQAEQKERQLEYFLIGLSPSTIQSKLGAKLTRLLHKYRTRKMKWENRAKEWTAFNASKPVEGINPIEDELEIKNAQETIGDFKLKSSADYRVPPQLRESTVKKYKKLLEARKKQFVLINNFNKKVYALRDKKCKMIKMLQELDLKLKSVQKEIPKNAHKFGPPIPAMSPKSFPEDQLKVVIAVPDPSETDIKTIGDIAALVEPPVGDRLEKLVLPRAEVKEKLENRDVFSKLSIEKIEAVSQADFDTFLDYAANEDEDTPWEEEIRIFRISRKLYEQDEIIKKMEDSLKEFDEDLLQLSRQTNKTQIDAYFLDLHLLTLHQELIILKDFEALEDELSAVLHQRMIEVMDMQDLMTDMNNKIEAHKREIEIMQGKANEIQQQFFNAVADNKFYDFLRRIFKKKYRPPKVRNADDSESDTESSSSESDSESEDEGSIDSRDFGIIKLDESVCPKGCDQAIYDLTFELRNKRHEIENQIIQENKVIEMLRKELDVNNKKIKIIESNLEASKDELETFQREKQRKLNTVHCTVILTLDRLQHLVSRQKVLGITDTLVFSKSTLSKLYKRVGQLSTETLQQKAKHKVNITHLCRMKTDCNSMRITIDKLNEELKELSIMKFGRVYEVDEVEEAHLKRMVFDLRMSKLDIQSLYQAETCLWAEKYAEKQKELLKEIQNNTAIVELLGLLNREKAELAKIISQQEKKRQHLENLTAMEEIYGRETERLCQIVKSQRKQIEELKDEIQRLKTKGLPQQLEKKPKQEPCPFKKVEEIDEILDWSGYDDFVRQMLASEEKERELMEESLTARPSISIQAEDQVRSILNEMFQSLESTLAQKSTESLIQSIISRILNKCTVAEIIDDLLNNLPIEPSDDQQSIVEFTAERLYSLQAPEVTESDINQCACELLYEIINDAMMLLSEPYEALIFMLTNLVQQLPLQFLMRDVNIEIIVFKFKTNLSSTELDKQQLEKAVSNISPAEAREVSKILEEILERVFGEGMDYLYFIKNI